MSKTVEVLLQENVLKLGTMGDIVRVKAGYARNYLLPRGKAIMAGVAAKRQVEVLRERAARQEAENEAQAVQQKAKIEGLKLTIAAKVSHDDHLFGSVGVREIVAAMGGMGFTIDPKQVHVHESFRKLGEYAVVLRLYKQVDATIVVTVVDSDPEGKSLQETIDEATGGTEVAAEEQA